MIDYVINHFLFQFWGRCSSFVPVLKIDWNTQVLDYIKKKRVCSTVPVFSGEGRPPHAKLCERESGQRGVSTNRFPTRPLSKMLEQRNKAPIFHLNSYLYINFISIYLIKTITYALRSPRQSHQPCPICKQKTGTSMEHVEQNSTRFPSLSYFDPLTYT